MDVKSHAFVLKKNFFLEKYWFFKSWRLSKRVAHGRNGHICSARRTEEFHIT